MKLSYLATRKGRRKAVSPVIAVVLLIALTVAAAAAIWAITNDVISLGGSDELILENSGVGDLNGNTLGDTMRLLVRNIGASEAVLEGINVYVNDEAAPSWVLYPTNVTYTVPNGQQGEIYAVTANTGDMIISTDKVEIELDSQRSISERFSITVPSILASIAILYDLGTALSTAELAAQGWVQHQIGSHSGASGAGFEVVPANPNEITVTTNNDLLFVLENNQYSLGNFLISTEITNGDNDFLGIIFRYTDLNNFYWVGVTSDHHSSSNRAGDPTAGAIPYVYANRDAIVFGKVEAGVSSIIGIGPVDPTLHGNNNQITWTKTFQLAVGGNTFSMNIDGNEVLQVTDSTFPSAGYLGFASLAGQNSRFGNIIIQS